MFLNPETLEAQQRYKLLIGSVIPRPIAFVSTIGNNGVRNVAPYSFFNVVCFNPMILAFFPIRYKTGSEIKDTVRNISETGEFCINVSTEALAEQITKASGLYEYGVDEFELTGLMPVKSKVIKAPGVFESPIRFECILEKMIRFGEDTGGSDGIFGKVVSMYIDDALIDNFKIDEGQLNPIARLAGNKFSTLGNIFEIERPS